MSDDQKPTSLSSIYADAPAHAWTSDHASARHRTGLRAIYAFGYQQVAGNAYIQWGPSLDTRLERAYGGHAHEHGLFQVAELARADAKAQLHPQRTGISDDALLAEYEQACDGGAHVVGLRRLYSLGQDDGRADARREYGPCAHDDPVELHGDNRWCGDCGSVFREGGWQHPRFVTVKSKGSSLRTGLQFALDLGSDASDQDVLAAVARARDAEVREQEKAPAPGGDDATEVRLLAILRYIDYRRHKKAPAPYHEDLERDEIESFVRRGLVKDDWGFQLLNTTRKHDFRFGPGTDARGNPLQDVEARREAPTGRAVALRPSSIQDEWDAWWQQARMGFPGGPHSERRVEEAFVEGWNRREHYAPVSWPPGHADSEHLFAAALYNEYYSQAIADQMPPKNAHEQACVHTALFGSEDTNSEPDPEDAAPDVAAPEDKAEELSLVRRAHTRLASQIRHIMSHLLETHRDAFHELSLTEDLVRPTDLIKEKAGWGPWVYVEGTAPSFRGDTPDGAPMAHLLAYISLDSRPGRVSAGHRGGDGRTFQVLRLLHAVDGWVCPSCYATNYGAECSGCGTTVQKTRAFYAKELDDA